NYTQTRKILDVFRKLTLGRAVAQDEVFERLHRETRGLRRMDHYRDLLGEAVRAITGEVEEQGVQSLFRRGGTVVGPDTFRGIDDFEVVAYLVITRDQDEGAGDAV